MMQLSYWPWNHNAHSRKPRELGMVNRDNKLKTASTHAAVTHLCRLLLQTLAQLLSTLLQVCA